jgi:hypothetical protein
VLCAADGFVMVTHVVVTRLRMECCASTLHFWDFLGFQFPPSKHRHHHTHAEQQHSGAGWVIEGTGQGSTMIPNPEARVSVVRPCRALRRTTPGSGGKSCWRRFGSRRRRRRHSGSSGGLRCNPCTSSDTAPTALVVGGAIHVPAVAATAGCPGV